MTSQDQKNDNIPGTEESTAQNIAAAQASPTDVAQARVSESAGHAVMKELFSNALHIFEKFEHFTADEIYDFSHWLETRWEARRVDAK